MYDDYDYESIDDIARGEGFFIDDDGHWIPLEEAMDCGYEIEDLDDLYDDYFNEETEDWDE